MKTRWSVVIPLFSLLLVGCGSDSGTDEGTDIIPDQPVVSTTSGSMATISDENGTIAFIPNNTDVLVVPVTTALTGGAGGISTTLINLMHSVDSCSADPEAKKVFCVGYDNTFVAIVDVAGFLATGAEITFFEFDANASSSYNFSGGSCTNCGVIADPGDDRFIVSSGDGYRVFDYSGLLIDAYLTDLAADTPMDLATENFGFDPLNNRILSPEYETANNYVWVIDIDTDKIYRWDNRLVATTVDSEEGLVGLSNSFLDFTAEAAALDISTGMMVIGDEWVPRVVTVNMDEAVFNDTTSTFSAPYAVTEFSDVYSMLSLLTTGIAVESGNHMVLMEEEFADAIGVAQLPSSSIAGGFAISSYNTVAVPSPVAVCPATTTWYNIGDPHGLAVFTALVDGKSWGLLINGSKTCAAVIDMAALLNAPKQLGSNIVDSSHDVLANNVITFISLN